MRIQKGVINPFPTVKVLDSEEKWHYFAGGLSWGTIGGIVIDMIVVLVLLWIIKGKDSKSD